MDDTRSVFDVNPQNFQTDVIDRSRSVPVVVLFWAQQVPPAAEARALLERLVQQYQGKVALALVDVAQDQSLAQHLRVQALPSVRVVREGQLVEQLEGPQAESTFTALLDELTVSSADVLQAQLELALENGDYDTALELLQRAISEEPKNQAFRVELADVLIRQGSLDDARQVLAGIPEDTEGRERPQNRLEIVEEADGFGSRDELVRARDDDPGDLDACYRLAVSEAAAGELESALELAMTILQQDRKFREDIGRTTMLRIFTLLPKGSELAQRYRRRMFNFMH
jgi:putative thioredoxin